MMISGMLSCMAEKRITLEPTGQRVAENIKRLRGATQYKELSARLSEVGRPIPPLGLRRIEAGERRVDVDDLVALAVVFGVSPLTLLLPEDGSDDLASYMTAVPWEVAHNVQWLWALGEEPLQLPDAGQGDEAQRAKRVYSLRAKPTVDPRSNAVVADWDSGAPDFEDQLLERLAKKMVAQGLVPSDASVETTPASSKPRGRAISNANKTGEISVKDRKVYRADWKGVRVGDD